MPVRGYSSLTAPKGFKGVGKHHFCLNVILTFVIVSLFYIKRRDDYLDNDLNKVLRIALMIVAILLIVMGLTGYAETMPVGIATIAVWISLREEESDSENP